jgi:hypothetical protein
MPWISPYPVLIWVVVFLPFTIWMWLSKPNNKLFAILTLIDYGLVSLVCFLAINWAVVNYYLRFLTILLFGALILRLIKTSKHSPFLPNRSILHLSMLGVSLLILPFAAYYAYRVVQSTSYRSYAGKPVLLLFPVRNGIYVIANGGNGLDGLGMNDAYHDWLGRPSGASQELVYAIDITEMTTGGTISQGILPGSYLRYEGFQDLVYSPCPGQVVAVEDGHPDLQPFAVGPPETNKIVIQCFEFYVTLENLRAGSIRYQPGDQVGLGLIIADVGNPGTAIIPHLRVHASVGAWDGSGQGVPMLFEGAFAVDRFVVRNTIFIPQ